jgi:hypothetical protein
MWCITQKVVTNDEAVTGSNKIRPNKDNTHEFGANLKG